MYIFGNSVVKGQNILFCLFYYSHISHDCVIVIVLLVICNILYCKCLSYQNVVLGK